MRQPSEAVWTEQECLLFDPSLVSSNDLEDGGVCRLSMNVPANPPIRGRKGSSPHMRNNAISALHLISTSHTLYTLNCTSKNISDLRKLSSRCTVLPSLQVCTHKSPLCIPPCPRLLIYLLDKGAQLKKDDQENLYAIASLVAIRCPWSVFHSLCRFFEK